MEELLLKDFKIGDVYYLYDERINVHIYTKRISENKILFCNLSNTATFTIFSLDFDMSLLEYDECLFELSNKNINDLSLKEIYDIHCLAFELEMNDKCEFIEIISDGSNFRVY